MTKPVPQILYEQSLVGHGSVSAEGSSTVPVAYWRLSRPAYAPTVPWYVELRVDPGAKQALQELVGGKYAEFQLKGSTDAGAPISVRSIRWNSHGIFTGLLTGRAYEGTVGHLRIASKITEQWCKVVLSHTPIARKRNAYDSYSDTGQIIGEGSRVAPLVIGSRLGRMSVQRAYAYESAAVGTREAKVRIPESVITFAPEGGPWADVEALLDAVERELSDVLRVMGMLNRKPVFWSRITIYSRSGENHYETRRYATPVDMAEGRDPEWLLDYAHLPDDALAHAVDAFRASPYRATLRSATSYLTACYGSAYVEQGLTVAFTALETLVNGITEVDGAQLVVSDNDFRTLRRAVQDAIRGVAPELGLTNEQRAALYTKLAELQRSPIIPRIVRCVESLRIRWSDLWPEGVTLHQALRSAFAIRNAFVHAGTIDDGNAAAITAKQIHALAERIALRLLRCDDSWWFWRAYYHVYGGIGQYPPVSSTRLRSKHATDQE